MAQDKTNDLGKLNIKLGPTINKDRYICPETGAHFEFNKMCILLSAMSHERDFKYKMGQYSKNKVLNRELKSQNEIQKMQQKLKEAGNRGSITHGSKEQGINENGNK